jgi:hypothetical protein
MPRLTTPPVWREATPDEAEDYLAGRWFGLEVRETAEGLEVLEGDALPCGCVPHHTYMRGMWGFYCETEDQGYCNFECPHEDEEGQPCAGPRR